jgi:hypothetical protein
LELRQKLGQSMDAYDTGTAVQVGGGSTTQFSDPPLKERWREDKALIGTLVHIRITTDGLAPQGESRYASAYDGSTGVVTVDRPFSAPIHTGDKYDLYRVPYMPLIDWNEAINRAILSAWPELYLVNHESLPLVNETMKIPLDTDAMIVESVMVRPLVPGLLSSYPAKQLRSGVDYAVYGTPGVNMTLAMFRPLDTDRFQVTVHERMIYPVLHPNLDTDSTDLDTEYILLAARAEMSQYLADKTRDTADRSYHLQLVNYYRTQADNRKKQIMTLDQLAKKEASGAA